MEKPTYQALIISDLHLCSERPETAKLLIYFLQKMATLSERLYILGDFFEFWAGDDTADDFHLNIANHLKTLSETGVKIFIMPGNRDLLIGEQFCQHAGATYIADPNVIELAGQKILLAHGDAYCTDDLAYMRYRRWVTKPWLQKIFLCLPKWLRLNLAKQIRKASQKSHKNRAMPTDVNLHAIKNALREHHVKTIIHGHTHRFAKHQFNDKQRFVLGDWHEHGSAISISTNKIELHDIYLPS